MFRDTFLKSANTLEVFSELRSKIINLPLILFQFVRVLDTHLVGELAVLGTAEPTF